MTPLADARPANGTAWRKNSNVLVAINTAIQKVREAYFSIQIISHGRVCGSRSISEWSECPKAPTCGASEKIALSWRREVVGAVAVGENNEPWRICVRTEAEDKQRIMESCHAGVELGKLQQLCILKLYTAIGMCHCSLTHVPTACNTMVQRCTCARRNICLFLFNVLLDFPRLWHDIMWWMLLLLHLITSI